MFRLSACPLAISDSITIYHDVIIITNWHTLHRELALWVADSCPLVREGSLGVCRIAVVAWNVRISHASSYPLPHIFHLTVAWIVCLLSKSFLAVQSCWRVVHSWALHLNYLLKLYTNIIYSCNQIHLQIILVFLVTCA